MAEYRFRDGMGDVVSEGEFADHAEALASARDDDADVERVEYLDERGEWRWAGPVEGG